MFRHLVIFFPIVWPERRVYQLLHAVCAAQQGRAVALVEDEVDGAAALIGAKKKKRERDKIAINMQLPICLQFPRCAGTTPPASTSMTQTSSSITSRDHRTPQQQKEKAKSKKQNPPSEVLISAYVQVDKVHVHLVADQLDAARDVVGPVVTNLTMPMRRGDVDTPCFYLHAEDIFVGVAPQKRPLTLLTLEGKGKKGKMS